MANPEAGWPFLFVSRCMANTGSDQLFGFTPDWLRLFLATTLSLPQTRTVLVRIQEMKDA
jgi:hypothetical protein